MRGFFSSQMKSKRERAKIFIYLYQFLYHTGRSKKRRKNHHEIQTKKTITFRSPCVIFCFSVALRNSSWNFTSLKCFRTECGHYFMCECVRINLNFSFARMEPFFFICSADFISAIWIVAVFIILLFCAFFFFSSLGCARVFPFADRFYRWTLNWCAPFEWICIVYTNIYIRSPLPFAQRRKTDIYIHKDIVVVYRSFDFIGFCSSKVN